MNTLAESSTKFIANESGSNWIEEHPEFTSLASEFCTTKQARPEYIFDDYQFIGMGQRSDVRSCGGIAVKVSTRSTGREAYDRGYKLKPENLIGQFKLLSALGQYLEDSEDVTVPEQYFALSTPSGNIRGEELMTGWASLRSLMSKGNYTEQEKEDIHKKTEDRLNRAIGGPLLRIGLDLGIDANESIKYENILMPKGSDPEAGRLCIIDQPSPTLSGNLAVFIQGAVSSFRVRQKPVASVYA